MWAAGVLELGKPRKKVGGLRASGYVRLSRAFPLKVEAQSMVWI